MQLPISEQLEPAVDAAELLSALFCDQSLIDLGTAKSSCDGLELGLEDPNSTLGSLLKEFISSNSPAYVLNTRKSLAPSIRGGLCNSFLKVSAVKIAQSCIPT